MKDCVSLEIAKKLKEAGWKQLVEDGVQFWWLVPCDGRTPHVEPFRINEAIEEPVADSIAAPTIGELLEALPVGIELYKERDDESRGDYCAQLDPDGPNAVKEIMAERWADPCYSPNPADALALLWMALKERGIL